MARERERLTARKVQTLSKPGRYGDGANLWLQVSRWGTKSWLFRYTRDGVARSMGLGAFPDITLARARAKALECRLALDADRDPLAERRQERQAKQAASAKALTFRECSERFIASKSPQWVPEHTAQWHRTLGTFAWPIIGDLPVSAIDTNLVLRVLEPIWITRTVTASRIRSRIENILDWATTRGLREGENPARWRGHLANLLSAPAKTAEKTHFAALAYPDLPAFMARLRALSGAPARCVEFTILTAARARESLRLPWSELNFERALWTLPKERTKGRHEHIVPLSLPAIRVLDSVRGLDEHMAFPGSRRGRKGSPQHKPMSPSTMRKVLRALDCGDVTVHGFRSTFRDWCAERTSYPSEVAEMALGHAISNKVEAAYRRGALLEKRRRLMEEWARYCELPAAQGAIAPLRGAADSV